MEYDDLPQSYFDDYETYVTSWNTDKWIPELEYGELILRRKNKKTEKANLTLQEKCNE